MSDDGIRPFIMRFSSALDRTPESLDGCGEGDGKRSSVEGSAAVSDVDDTRWTRVDQETTDDD